MKKFNKNKVVDLSTVMGGAQKPGDGYFLGISVMLDGFGDDLKGNEEICLDRKAK